MKTLNPDLIEEIVRRVTGAVHPLRVILFGSAARGEMSPESDIDLLAVGQHWEGDQRVVLFVKMKPGVLLSEALQSRIKEEIKVNASLRHVPALIVEVPDIPYTFNMKKVESAVAHIVNGNPVTNRDVLRNPESLEAFEKILPKLKH